MIAAGRRLRPRRAVPTAMPASGFLPFLDVITATIGIFLLIYTFQILKDRVENRQMQPDRLFLCLSAEALQFLPGRDAEPVRVVPSELAALVKSIAGEADGSLNLLFARGPGCGRLGSDFLRTVRQVNMTTTPGRASLRVSQWPLGDAGSAERLRQRWRDGGAAR